MCIDCNLLMDTKRNRNPRISDFLTDALVRAELTCYEVECIDCGQQVHEHWGSGKGCSQPRHPKIAEELRLQTNAMVMAKLRGEGVRLDIKLVPIKDAKQ